jgi:hypothetical protein
VNYENEEYGIVMEVTRQMTIATRQEEPRMDGPIQNITETSPTQQQQQIDRRPFTVSSTDHSHDHHTDSLLRYSTGPALNYAQIPPFFLSSNIIRLKLYGIKHFIRAQEMKKASPIAKINSPINPAISHLFFSSSAGVLHFSAAVHFFFLGVISRQTGSKGQRKKSLFGRLDNNSNNIFYICTDTFFVGDEGKI